MTRGRTGQGCPAAVPQCPPTAHGSNSRPLRALTITLHGPQDTACGLTHIHKADGKGGQCTGAFWTMGTVWEGPGSRAGVQKVPWDTARILIPKDKELAAEGGSARQRAQPELWLGPGKMQPGSELSWTGLDTPRPPLRVALSVRTPGPRPTAGRLGPCSPPPCTGA